MTLHPDFQRLKDEHEAAKAQAPPPAPRPETRIPTEEEIERAGRRQYARDWWLGRTPEQLASKERVRARLDGWAGSPEVASTRRGLQKFGLVTALVGLVWTLFISVPILLFLF